MCVNWERCEQWIMCTKNIEERTLCTLDDAKKEFCKIIQSHMHPMYTSLCMAQYTMYNARRSLCTIESHSAQEYVHNVHNNRV